MSLSHDPFWGNNLRVLPKFGGRHHTSEKEMESARLTFMLDDRERHHTSTKTKSRPHQRSCWTFMNDTFRHERPEVVTINGHAGRSRTTPHVSKEWKSSPSTVMREFRERHHSSTKMGSLPPRQRSCQTNCRCMSFEQIPNHVAVRSPVN